MHSAGTHQSKSARTLKRTYGLNEWAALVPEIEMLTSADEHTLCIGAERVQQITLVDRTTNVAKIAPLHVWVIWCGCWHGGVGLK